MVPTWLSNGPWRSLLDVLEASWSLEKSLVGSRRVSRGVWGALGRLLEAFGAKETKLGSALGRPKGTRDTGFALPEGQISAQKESWRVLKLAPKANQAENQEPIKIVDSTADFLDF